MIPDSFKQELLHRVDIVDVIERYVPLKKSGANHLACCPFHSEKTPSFTVSPAKQFYHCFGCGAHGNAISFLMEYQGLGYVEAVKDLAESVGMKMPEFEPRGKKPEAGPDLYAIMERACDYYRDQLKAAPRAIEYLKGRGLTGKIAGRFGIGYAPDGWQNLEGVFPNYADKSLKDAGLVVDPEGGGRRYDRFRDRIMFPILNQRGSVIAFGGRVLGEGEATEAEGKGSPGPKYLNSPETPLFEKGRELYGLTQARPAIRTAGCVIVVEGYMDVVALAQHGIEYSVATLGTATSAVHVQKLLRQTDEVVFCFDGDAAGRKAAWHALEVSLPYLADNKSVRFLFLPPEHDPDSFVRERGKAVFEKGLNGAQPLSGFLLEELKARADVKTPEGRSRLAHDAKPLLQKISAPALQLQLLKMLADAAGMTQEETARITEIRAASGYGARPAPARGMDRGAQAPELRLVRILLQCLISKPALAKELSPELLDQGSLEARALVAVAEFCREKPETEGNIVVDHFQGTEFRGLLESSQAALLDTKLEAEHMEVDFRGALERLQDKRRQQRFEALRVKPGRTPEEEAEMLRLLRERKQTPASASNNAIISGSRAIS
ncbi:MAG TPA: DNA primase [Burkholderiales bacterium]|nr:DNA primase [Burkholderiales bacterium]